MTSKRESSKNLSFLTLLKDERDEKNGERINNPHQSFSIGEMRNEKNGEKMELDYNFASLAQGLIETFVKRQNTDWSPFATGFPLLDGELGGGFSPAQVHFLAAQPGAGKTSFMINAAIHNCRQGKPTFFITAELSTEDLISRFITIMEQDVGVDWNSIRMGKNIDVIIKHFKEMVSWPLYILGSEALDKGEGIAHNISKIVEQVIETHKVPPIVFVDYLQQIALRYKKEQQNKRVSTDYRQLVDNVSAGFVSLANEQGCCVVCVSSTARTNYRGGSEDNKNVNVLSMAKESGQIEFDAGTVSGLLSGKRYKGDDGESRQIVEFKIGKNRFYKCGVGVEFSMIGATGQFEEINIVEGFDVRESRFCEAVDSGEYKNYSEIAEETGMSPASVGRKIKQYGYVKVDGKYVKDSE